MTRVEFDAPPSLVERADQFADVLDISRSRLLVEALEEKIEELACNEEFRHCLSEDYYAGRVDFETIELILDREEASRMRLLKESIYREPPDPKLVGDLPSDEEFYDSSASAGTPNNSR